MRNRFEKNWNGTRFVLNDVKKVNIFVHLGFRTRIAYCLIKSAVHISSTVIKMIVKVVVNKTVTLHFIVEARWRCS